MYSQSKEYIDRSEAAFTIKRVEARASLYGMTISFFTSNTAAIQEFFDAHAISHKRIDGCIRINTGLFDTNTILNAITCLEKAKHISPELFHNICKNYPDGHGGLRDLKDTRPSDPEMLLFSAPSASRNAVASFVTSSTTKSNNK